MVKKTPITLKMTKKGDIMAEHYESKHTSSGHFAPREKSRLPLIILALVLCFCIAGAGAYALVHYVIFAPSQSAPPSQSAANALPSAPPDPTLAPIPTESPTGATAAPDYSAAAKTMLDSMSTRDKICQIMIVTPEALTGVDGVNQAGDTTKNALAEYPVGGIIYNTVNLESPAQTRALIKGAQRFTQIPLFISVDEEGGEVARVAEKLGTTAFEPMYSYKDQGETVAQNNAHTIATDLHDLGFNLDFAPVADVRTNPDNTVIGTRAYSDSYEQAAGLVASAVKGFAQGGVMSTLKHFPGQGGTSGDTHEGLSYIDAPIDALKAGELLPFKSGIEAGADMVMVGHLVVNALDDQLPATLSPKVVPELLRSYLNYDGVVITDGMMMGAITDNYDVDTIVKGIFDADIDIILLPDSPESYVAAMEKALENGAITTEQLDRKVMRILSLKYQKGIIPMN